MKSILIAIISLTFCSQLFYSQFREIPTDTRTKIRKSGGLILGFINPKNFSLSHSVNISYYTDRNYSLSTTSYTATLGYKISDKMNLTADITLQYSPYVSFGASNTYIENDIRNSLNGFKISRVSFDYRPSKNMFINVEYLNYNNNLLPYDYYFDYYNPYRSNYRY